MHPLIPGLIAFICGIIFSRHGEIPAASVYVPFAVTLSIPVILYYKGSRFIALSSAPAFFMLGALFISPFARPEFPPEHIKNFIMKEDYASALGHDVEGVIAASPEFTAHTTRLLVSADALNAAGKRIQTTGLVQLVSEGQLEGWRTGDRVRFIARLKEPANFGNPGEYDFSGRLNLRGIFTTGWLKDGKLLVKIQDGEAGLARFTEDVRERVRLFIEKNSDNAEVLKALVIAERGGVEPALRDAFVKTGTAHILAISGLHVGVVAFFFYRFILFGLKRSERLLLALNAKKTAAMLSLPFVIVYGALAGFPTSAQRAVVMAVVFVIAFLFDRGKDFYNTLAVAALIILLIAPYSVWDIGFQLSFAAVFGIVYFLPRFKGFFEREEDEDNKKNGIIKRFTQRRVFPAFAVTVAAWLGTAPLMAYHFNMVSATGAVANAIVIPLTGVIIPLVFLSSAISFVWEGGAAVMLYGADLCLEAVKWIVVTFTRIPFSWYWVSKPTPFETGLIYAALLAAANLNKRRVWAYAAVASALILVSSWGYWTYKAKASDELKVSFISIGQGDCALVELPRGKTMLVDGGGFYGAEFDTGERIVAPFLRYKKISKIDYMVLSHVQRDHISGLKFVAENFDIGEFWWNGGGSLGRLGAILSRKKIPVKILRAGDVFEIDGVRAETFNPEDGSGFDKNNNSLVLRLEYMDKRVLFTGDIAADAEEKLSGKDIKTDVLKVPHHGSRYSSSDEFVVKAAPTIAVISAGRGNVFGFPHTQTLDRYGRRNVRVYRTDRQGAVTIVIGPDGITEEAYLTGGV
ncbi:MAG: DNA internalization-related competence protein ComEC/Rec2 [Deltaproteobacteria bacterium]|nr:DNA internalization-related competence protein ComEC/Rec2 [Deltaproteobacteria bacterium]